jgi:ABC-type transporter Mla maintaining outer membrane lipid asymmetry ATPase subunit MlaF
MSENSPAGVPPAIELKEVSAHSGGFAVLSGASAAFDECRVNLIMGNTGSGKSSILKAAAGLLLPTSGKVLFRGKDMHDFTKAEELAFRKIASFAFQDNALWANQNALWNLTLPLKVHRPDIGDKAAERIAYSIVESLGYYDSLLHRPAELSAGEQHVIAIARALILDPEILFFDQPLSHLDDESRDKFSEIIGALKARGKTIVMVTNSASFASRFCDKLFIVADGAIVASGPLHSIGKTDSAEANQILSRIKAREDIVEEAARPRPIEGPRAEAADSGAENGTGDAR